MGTERTGFGSAAASGSPRRRTIEGPLGRSALQAAEKLKLPTVSLLAAYEQARRHAPRAKLVLVGDGPMQAELKLRCPDAVFAGRRTGEDLARHFASATSSFFRA